MIANVRPKQYAIALVAASLVFAGTGRPAPVLAQSPAPAATLSARTLTLAASRRRGTTTVEIRGNGPAGAALTVTLTGEIARDLPVVLLARSVVTVSPDGSYTARLPLGSLSFPDSVVRATVSGAGLRPVHALLTVTDPDPWFNSPNNALPPDK